MAVFALLLLSAEGFLAFRQFPSEADTEDNTEASDLLDLMASLKCRSKDTTNQRAMAHYRALLEKFKRVPEAVELHLFTTYGSNNLVQEYLSVVDNIQQCRIGHFFVRMKEVLRRSPFAYRSAHLTSLLLTITLYYSDVAKDVLIATHFKMKILGNVDMSSLDRLGAKLYPLAIFGVIVVSVLLTEVLNAVVIWSELRHSWRKAERVSIRIATLLLTPLMPAIILYAEMWTRLQAAKVSSSKSLKLLRRLRMQSESLKILGSQLRSNENLVEHFIQMALFILILLTEQSRSTAVQTVGNIIVESSQAVVLLAITASFVSIIRGYVSYIAAGKKGHLSMLGKLILAAYIATCSAGRLWALIVYFTPVFGLFNILMMAKKGVIPASPDTVADILPNGTVVSLEEKWGQLFELRHLFDLYQCAPTTIINLTVVSMLIGLHICLGLYLLRRYTTMPRLGLIHVFHTFVCPPLLPDWEEICREGSGTIKSSWIRCQRYFASHLVLSAFENACLCIPLAMLRYKFERRRQLMEENFFPLLPEEEQSLHVADVLICTSVAVFLVLLPACQYSLGMIYFRHGHPWARLKPWE